MRPPSRKMRPLSRAEVRGVDRRAIADYGMSGLVLMENAGRNAAEVIHRLATGSRVTVVCGTGNNAGDGFVIARHLELLGRDVVILLAASPEKLAADAVRNHAIAFAAEIPMVDLSRANGEGWEASVAAGRGGVIVDALLGTGAHGPPRGPIALAIAAINRTRSGAEPAARTEVIAIDLPSGLDCDTGSPMGECVRADATVTFVAPKQGFDAPGAAAFTGSVHVVDIGVPRKLLDEIESRPHDGRGGGRDPGSGVSTTRPHGP